MIALNINNVREKISQKCEKIGRDSGEITLIAVSKTKPVADIIEAFENGINNFGENKAQEFRDKTAEIDKDIVWHFIGHLQTNKVKYVIKDADFIHSLDSLKLAAEIQKKAEAINKIQNVLIEIKTSGEETKFGLSNEKEIREILDFCTVSENLNVKGLMTMAPFTGNETVIRSSFSKLAKLMDELNKYGYNLTELSMGMTSDYLIAIEEGATMVRIGTAIFGSRNY